MEYSLEKVGRFRRNRRGCLPDAFQDRDKLGHRASGFEFRASNFGFSSFLLGFFIFAGLSLPAQEIGISPLCSNFYAGKEHKLDIATGLPSEKIAWRLSYTNRTIASGEKVSDNSGKTELVFNFPELNPGIVANAQLSLLIGGQTKVKDLTFFHPNPFALSKKVLEEMKIALWAGSDSNAKTVLDKLEVPYVEIANFAEFTGSILLIDRIDFTGFSDIEKELTAICMRGARVIVINPQHGNFTLPASAREIHLADSKRIASFNKKLDSEFWGTTYPNSSSIRIRGDENSPAITVSEGKNGFSYFSAKFAKGGEMTICTWEIFEKAAISPTPIYLLKEMVLGGEGIRH